MNRLPSPKWLLKLFPLVVALGFSTISRAYELEIYTEDTPVLSFVDEKGQLTGSSVEIVQAIQKLVGNHDKIQLVPWARGYSYITQPDKTNIVLFSGAFTEERRDKFKWVGPIVDVAWAFYAKADSDLIVNSLEDVKKVARIGVVIGDVRVKILEEQGFTNLVGVTNNDQNMKMLLRNRIDLWFGDPLSVRGYSERKGLEPKLFKPLFSFQSQGLFILFHKNTPDAIVEKWRSAYNKLMENGTIESIMAKWQQTKPTFNIPPRPFQ